MTRGMEYDTLKAVESDRAGFVSCDRGLSYWFCLTLLESVSML